MAPIDLAFFRNIMRIPKPGIPAGQLRFVKRIMCHFLPGKSGCDGLKTIGK